MRMFVLLALAAGAPLILAQGKGPASYTFKAAYVDQYLFRGRVFHNDDAWLGELGFGIGKFSYNLLYAKPMDETPLLEEEQNHAISYTTLTRRAAVTVGYQVYNYDGLIPDTQEFFTRVAFLRSPWNFIYGLAYDIDAYRGYYLDFSLGRDIPFTTRSDLQFRLQGGLSYDLDEERDEQRDLVLEQGFYGKSGLNHGVASLKWVWRPAAWFKLDLGAHYHYAFDDALYDDVVIDQGNLVGRAAITIVLP